MARPHQKAPRAENWSNLPPEILSAIGKRLGSGFDIKRCRSVCKNWRASLNSNPTLISLFLPRKFSNFTLPFNNRPNDPLLLVARAVFQVQPCSSSLSTSDLNHWILTAEEIVQGKLRILYPLSKDHFTSLPSNFPSSLNLLDYKMSEIAKSYGFKYASDGKDVCGVNKVILCSDYTAMVLYGEKGTLIGVKLKNGKWGFVGESLITSFSDLICYKGMVCAVDCKGNLHTVDYKTMKVVKRVAPNLSCLCSLSRKRLVEHEGKLLLVAWSPGHINSSKENTHFVAYRLDEMDSIWVQAKLLGCVLFVSQDWCYVVGARGLNISDHLPKRETAVSPYLSRTQSRSSCYMSRTQSPPARTQSPPWNVAKRQYLVLSQSCFNSSVMPVRLQFNSYPFEGTSENLSINFFFFRNEEQDRLDYLYSTIAGTLWAPTMWLLQDTYTSSGDDEDNEGLDSWDPDDSTDSKIVLPPSILPPFGAAKSDRQDLVPKTTGVSRHPVHGASRALKIQNFHLFASTTMFEGVKIKSNFVLTLQDIWAKHGNILEGSSIRNGDLIAKALESLATAVLILQSSSGRSLNEVQAEYLSSTLSDLQQMQFKVDWLVPFVEMALAVHKSKSLVDSMKEFDEAKTRAEEMKLKLLDELAKLDEMEEDMKFIFDKIPRLESVDLNQSLGEGIC